MVVSAPGKRSSVPGDIKLTDRLIDLSETKEKKGSVDTDIVNEVDEQIRSICTGLSLPDELPDQLIDDILTLALKVDPDKLDTRRPRVRRNRIRKNRYRLPPEYGYACPHCGSREAELLVPHQ